MILQLQKTNFKARLSPDNGNNGQAMDPHVMPSPPCMNPSLFSLLGKRGIAQ